jgi:hypothetical protein
MPVVVVAQVLEYFRIDLFGHGFGFLKTKHVGLGSFEPIGKTFVECGSNAIDVIREYFQ